MSSEQKKRDISVIHANLRKALSSDGIFAGCQNGNPIQIPPYQRGYQWNIQDCTTLITSILDVAFQNLEDKTHRDYFKPEVLSEFNDNYLSNNCHELSSWQYCISKDRVKGNDTDVIKIIDGQQRLTTLLLLCRALLTTICAVYDDPHIKFSEGVQAKNNKVNSVSNVFSLDEEEDPAELLERKKNEVSTVMPQQILASQIVEELIRILSAHDGNTTVNKGKPRGILENAPVLYSKAIDKTSDVILRSILKSGYGVPPKKVKHSDKYLENYRFFLTVLSHPALTHFYTLDPKTGELINPESNGYIYTEEKDEDLAVYKYSGVFAVWPNNTDKESAEISVSLKEYKNFSPDIIKSLREIFYLNINVEDWTSPTQNAFAEYTCDHGDGAAELKDIRKGINVESANKDKSQVVPFLLYFALTLINNVKIILHRLADEESALKVFYLTNTAGHPLPRENIIRAEFYQAKLEQRGKQPDENTSGEQSKLSKNDGLKFSLESDKETTNNQVDTEKDANDFIDKWNNFELDLVNTFAHRSEKSLEHSTREALEMALAYFNLVDFTHENKQDGAVGDLVKYGLNYWAKVQKIDTEHVDKVMEFLKLYLEFQKWLHLRKSKDSWISKFFDSNREVEYKVLSYLRALNLLGESSLLQPVMFYFIHNERNQHLPTTKQIITFVEKHVANTLYRTVVHNNPLHNYSALSLCRDICGARYARESFVRASDISELTIEKLIENNSKHGFGPLLVFQGKPAEGNLVLDLCRGRVKVDRGGEELDDKQVTELVEKHGKHKVKKVIDYRIGAFDKNKFLSMAVDSSVRTLQTHNLEEISNEVLTNQVETLKTYLTETSTTQGGEVYFNQFLKKSKSSYVRFVLALLELLTTKAPPPVKEEDSSPDTEEQDVSGTVLSNNILVSSTAEQNRILSKHRDTFKSKKDGIKGILIAEIEHITPQESTSSELHKSEHAVEWNELVDSLGNLALLEKHLNIKARNSVTKKKEAYAASEFPAVRYLKSRPSYFETSKEDLVDLFEKAKYRSSVPTAEELKHAAEKIDVVLTEKDETNFSNRLFATIRIRTLEQASLLTSFFQSASDNYWSDALKEGDYEIVKYHNRSSKIEGEDSIKLYRGIGEGDTSIVKVAQK